MPAEVIDPNFPAILCVTTSAALRKHPNGNFSNVAPWSPRSRDRLKFCFATLWVVIIAFTLDRALMLVHAWFALIVARENDRPHDGSGAVRLARVLAVVAANKFLAVWLLLCESFVEALRLRYL